MREGLFVDATVLAGALINPAGPKTRLLDPASMAGPPARRQHAARGAGGNRAEVIRWCGAAPRAPARGEAFADVAWIPEDLRVESELAA